ncbi:hypothetical protein [Klebsiella pneumoniae]|uniref:hypothetical protein n=1 Tax=Klebsiella pneumoniae TaxID=573 RepID=UPI0019D05B57|nr:hypothetical protein [Klebsiella pneumoniae]
MTELVLESPFNSALLLMDFQEFVLNNFVPAPRAAEVVARTSRFLSRVRQTDMLVVHVTVGCPPMVRQWTGATGYSASYVKVA